MLMHEQLSGPAQRGIFAALAPNRRLGEYTVLGKAANR